MARMVLARRLTVARDSSVSPARRTSFVVGAGRSAGQLGHFARTRDLTRFNPLEGSRNPRHLQPIVQTVSNLSSAQVEQDGRTENNKTSSIFWPASGPCFFWPGLPCIYGITDLTALDPYADQNTETRVFCMKTEHIYNNWVQIA